MGAREHWEKVELESHIRELRELLRLRRAAAEAEINKLRRTVSEMAEESSFWKAAAKLKELEHANELKAAKAETEAAKAAHEAQLIVARSHQERATEAEGREVELRDWIESALQRFRENKHAREWLCPILRHMDGDKRTPLDPPAPVLKKVEDEKWAAVSIVRAEDKYLCVWNKRYKGWSFPGGLVEKGEAIGDAQVRELLEEAGLHSLKRELIFAGPTGLDHEPSRAGNAAIYAVLAWSGYEKAEEGSEIRWLTRDEYLAGTPFASFYRDQVFPKYDEACLRRGYPTKPPYYVSR